MDLEVVEVEVVEMKRKGVETEMEGIEMDVRL